jgi:hypothetical protein
MRTISFNLNGFWFHVKMDGNTGVDQHGDRYYLQNGKLYAEHSYHVIEDDENVQIDEMIYNQR